MSYTYLTTYSVGKHQQCHQTKRGRHGLQWLYETKNYILLSARTETTENLQPIGRRRHQASGWGTLKFIKWYKRTGTITWKPGSRGSSKLTREIKQLIESNMRANDETMAMQLHQMLTSHGYNLSKRTILRYRSALGWTFRGSTYVKPIKRSVYTGHYSINTRQMVVFKMCCGLMSAPSSWKHIEGCAVGRGKAA